MSELRTHAAVKAYVQHGFYPTNDNEKEIFGICPFCTDREHKHIHTFYVNKETKDWNCRSCGKEGGFLTFLKEMSLFCQEHFKGTVAIKLSKSRSISIKTLKKFKLGYNPITKNYCFPVIGADRERIQDLRIYTRGKIISTTSCKTGLLNWMNLHKSDEIFLCEGEWDGMALDEILEKIGDSNATYTAVPGAGTFKGEWISLFTDKTVHVLYDNDDPGQKGALKVFNSLKRECRSLDFLHWSNNFEDGFDVRDLYKQFRNAVRTHNFIMANLNDLPMKADIDEVMKEGLGKQKFAGDGMFAKDVYDAYKKWLYLPDTSVLDVAFSTIIANRLDGDPLWMFIVAPPGMTKTSILQTVVDAREVIAISTLTPRTLISGSNAGGVDPSLIPKLNNKVLTIKDFTTILNMNQQAREEIFGVLRDIYDGECSKPFGHGVTRTFKSKFGILAAVTPVIEIFMESETALGERFLRFAMKLPKSTKEHMIYMRRATENIKNKKNMLSNLRSIGPQVLDYDFLQHDVGIPDRIHTKILYLSMWTAQLRGTIIRDRFSKDILFKPFQELATRIGQQYMKLLLGIGMFRRKDEVGDDEYNIIRKLALGSVPSKFEDAVSKLYKWGTKRKFQTHELSEMIKLPRSTMQHLIDDLHILGVLKKIRLSSVKTQYMFTNKFLDITENGGVYANNNN